MKNTIKINNHQFTRRDLLLLVCTCFFSSVVQSEVTLDGSVGPTGALTGPDYKVTENVGKRAGSNLFHSFGRFNLNASESATFSGSTGIKNVISRVTGGQTSNIDGTLRVSIPSANLYLLNPAGVIFGEHAKLDVPGSFHVSTADYLKFQDGVRFDSGAATAPQVLATAAPEAFGFLGENPAGISLSGSTGSVLEVQKGSTISLIGGDITSENTALYAPGGQINIASVDSAGEVSFNESGIHTTSFRKMGDIRISQNPLISRTRLETGFIVGNIDASADTAGKIYIRGGQMVMDNSFIASDPTNGKGGDIRVGLTGDLNISAPERTLGGLFTGSEISTSTRGKGNAGSISLDVAKFSLGNNSRINTRAIRNTDGNAGNITINANTIQLLEEDSDIDTEIVSSSFGDGDSGNITITADTLEIQAETGIENSTFSNGEGGDLTVNAKNLKIFDGGELRNITGPIATNKGGNLTVDAENILLSGKGTEITAETLGSGQGGDLKVTSDRLEVRNGAEIVSSTAGEGNGGNGYIEAKKISLSGVHENDDSTGITAVNRHFDNKNFGGVGRETGNSGSLTVKSKNLIVENGAQINTSNYSGTGRSGKVLVESDNILLKRNGEDVTGIINNSFHHGEMGELTVNATNLKILNGASIRSLAFSSADSSDININSKNIRLSGKEFTEISTRTAFSNTGGDAGDITISTDQLELQVDAEISTTSTVTARSVANSGNLTITAGQINLKDNTKIATSTDFQGDAGNILIYADNLIQSGGTISSQTDHFGNAGDIAINANHIKLTSGSKIDAKTTSAGHGGNLTVNANTIFISNGDSEKISGIFALSENTTDPAGNAGDLEINSNYLEMRDDALISAHTEGPGQGGDLTVDVNNILLDDARLSSASRFKDTGFLLDADFLGDADVTKSGNIKITLGNTLRLKNNSGISVSTDKVNAGDIIITGGNVLHLSDSFITTSVADGKGNGGNISITTPIVGLDNSVIRAQAAEGHGGNINISGLIFQSPSSLISASSKLGADGKINLRPDTHISGSISVLPDTFLNASQQMSERCTARSENDLSSFVEKGRGGVPLSPGDLAPSNFMDYLQTEDYSLQDKASESVTLYSTLKKNKGSSHSGSGNKHPFGSNSLDCTQ